jgi:hypothetical protein
MNVELLSIIATIGLALFGYFVTYLYNLRLARRKERLELIERRLNEFYGPLFVASVAADLGYKTLLSRLHRRTVFDPNDPPTKEQLQEWRSWIKLVLVPLDDIREQLILHNAHLIRENEMPDCLMQFVAHVYTYRAVLTNWDEADNSRYEAPGDAPQELYDYAVQSYRELKAAQLSLIGVKIGR